MVGLSANFVATTFALQLTCGLNATHLSCQHSLPVESCGEGKPACKGFLEDTNHPPDGNL